jgi:hypothetical protein
MYQELPPPMRNRYSSVQQVAQTIRANYFRLSATSQIFAQQMDVKLDGLLSGYVRLLFAAKLHHEYEQSINPAQVQNDIAKLEKSMASEPLKVQEINNQRIEILRKRLVKFDKITENRQIIDAQCAAIEEVLQLIRDQSVSMRDPQEVSAQLDHLVQDVEQTEQSVKEIEAIFALASPESGEDLQLPVIDEAPQTRTRVRS